MREEAAVELGDHGARVGCVGAARDHDVAHGRALEIHRHEHLRHAGRAVAEAAREVVEGAPRAVAEVLAIEERPQRLEIPRRDRIARHLGAVERVLHPHRDRSVAGWALEEAAVLVVPEARVLRLGQRHRALEPPWVERGLVEVEEPERGVGVVVELARALRLALAPAAVQGAGRRVAQPLPQELGCPLTARGEGRLLERAGAARERRDHQPVPGRQHLVVAVRAHAPASDLEQLRTRSIEPALRLGRRDPEVLAALIDRSHLAQDRRPVLEVPVRCDAVAEREQRSSGAEGGFDLGGRPHVELALLPFAVGVLGGVERAIGR